MTQNNDVLLSLAALDPPQSTAQQRETTPLRDRAIHGRQRADDIISNFLSRPVLTAQGKDQLIPLPLFAATEWRAPALRCCAIDGGQGDTDYSSNVPDRPALTAHC